MRWVLAVPEESAFQRAEDLAGKTIATELVRVTKAYFEARKVDVDGESYRCARAYMIRLEPRDLKEPARLGRLAEAANMTPEQFRQRFAPVVAHG